MNLNPAVEQLMISKMEAFVDGVLEPVKEVVETEREPITKAKRKHELALEQQKTQQQLEEVQKSLESLEKEPNETINVWD
jgi:cell shape-determining protein MreC